MITRDYAAALVIALALVVAGFACELIDSQETFELRGASVRVSLTDDPSPDLAAAQVKISRVYLSGPDVDAPVVNLLDETEAPLQVDLLGLRKNVETMIAESEVTPGIYDELHVVVDDAEVELMAGKSFLDGTARRVVSPAQGSSEDIVVALSEPLAVEDGVMTLVVLDFAVDESFVVASYPDEPNLVGEIRFEPVLVEKRRHDIPLG